MAFSSLSHLACTKCGATYDVGPLLNAKRLGAKNAMPRLYVKEEAGNPTGSFKARGLGAAVTMAKALGARKLALPTAGNAGGAAAAYAAAAGLECHVFMPKDTPKVFKIECEAYGAHVTLSPIYLAARDLQSRR